MSRLIDADMLKHMIESMNFAQPFMDVTRVLYGVGIEIDNAPTIDAVEAVRGEWIDEPLASTNGGVYITHRCSVCEWQQPFEVFRYCPYCGARMDYKRKQYGERKESE